MSLDAAEKYIPAEFRMFSGCEDAQTSSDVSDVSGFQLPDPAGAAGGACTSTLLKVLYADEKDTAKDLTFRQVLMSMRQQLKKANFTQIPQLTSSRELDVDSLFNIVPSSAKGTRRALMIGINYVGQKGELSGCHNDVKNMAEYLKDVQGFTHISMLLDDGEHIAPTKANILWAIKSLVRNSMAGDVAYVHFSGHGGKVKDLNGDEEDGFDETLVPVDFAEAGQITDDTLYTSLVGPMRRGVTVTAVMDCCHSGTVLDLPYHFKADGGSDAMTLPPNFKFGTFEKLMNNFHEAMKKQRQETMQKEFMEFANEMLLPGEGCNGDDVVKLFKNGFESKYQSYGLFISYNECAKLLGDWNNNYAKADVTPKGWFMGFHLNPSKVRPAFRNS